MFFPDLCFSYCLKIKKLYLKKKILPGVGSCCNTLELVCFREDCYRILEFWCPAETNCLKRIKLFCEKLEYNAESNINNGGLAYEFLKERKDYIRVVYMILCIDTLWKGNFLCFSGTINNGQLRLKSQLILIRPPSSRLNLLGSICSGSAHRSCDPEGTKLVSKRLPYHTFEGIKVS